MSTLTDRARKLYGLARRNTDEADTIERITAMLRVTRQEGIKVGLDQAERYDINAQHWSP